MLRQKQSLTFHPALMNRASHTHRIHDLSIAQYTAGIVLRANRRFIRLGERGECLAFCLHANGDLHHRTNQCQHAQPRADKKYDQQIQQGSRCVHDRGGCGRGHEVAQGSQIIKHLQRAAIRILQVGIKAGIEQALA